MIIRHRRDWIIAVGTSVPAFEIELSLPRGFGVQPTPHTGPTALPNDPSRDRFVGRASIWPWIRNRRQTLRTAERGSSAGVLFVSIDRPPVQQLHYAGFGQVAIGTLLHTAFRGTRRGCWRANGLRYHHEGAVEIDLVLVGRSNVECPTNLKWIRAGFQPEKSRQALNPRVAQ